ncbi:MAG TPA: heparan-alpha-glucosaminide N-acetyltransferase domain-containing protein [Cyclobacteriaceae bacterium]|nr:heparan-alpha-glucosaminide N-acetyltransferase domain-containing protein [Cyclobacteriaceae bacterium]
MKRMQSLDIVRGLIMVLMAIDHVRVYSGVPAGGPDPAIFFTRWVTHFCAPGFAFFAGTAAFLYGLKVNDKQKLASYLFTRGLMLVVLEFTLIRLCWTFNLNLSEFMLAGVIWMLGICMILLGLVVRLEARTVAIIGLTIIFGQQLFALVSPLLPGSIRPYWEFIYSSGAEGPSWVAILYVIVPWIGVMMAGYGFGKILILEESKMRRYCHVIGAGAIAAFILFGIIFMKENDMPFILRLLNQQKYPASQLYLLMTLGPLIALIPYAEKMKGAVAGFFRVMGSVPFFYYLLHIPLIHITAVIINMILFGNAHHEWYHIAPFAQVPPENMWDLPLLYIAFVIDVALLYVACRWYADFKIKNPQLAWTKFI